MRLSVLVAELGHLMRSNSQRVAFSESCTGGLLSAIVTAEAGVSDFFQGAVVGYANSVKENILGVSKVSLSEFGAVSEKVAEEMANGICEKLGAHWGVAITGIAGPSGGTSEKPVGTVCFAVCGPKLVRAETKHFSGDRGHIQESAAKYALEFLIRCLKNNKKEN